MKWLQLAVWVTAAVAWVYVLTWYLPRQRRRLERVHDEIRKIAERLRK